MQLLSIFNNGSQAWIILIIMVVWGIGFGRASYKNYKGGWKQRVDANYRQGKKLSLWEDGYFKLLVIGEVAFIIAIFLINRDYK